MKLIFIFFAFLIAYSFSLNLFRYLRCKSLFQEHKLYFSSLTSGRAYEGNITYKQNEIIELFENANIPRPSFGQISPLGFGFVAKNVVDEFDNMFNLDERIVSNIIHCYEIAIGEYHHRMLNSINPLEWIRAIIFLPKTIIKYMVIILILK